MGPGQDAMRSDPCAKRDAGARGEDTSVRWSGRRVIGGRDAAGVPTYVGHRRPRTTWPLTRAAESSRKNAERRAWAEREGPPGSAHPGATGRPRATMSVGMESTSDPSVRRINKRSTREVSSAGKVEWAGPRGGAGPFRCAAGGLIRNGGRIAAAALIVPVGVIVEMMIVRGLGEGTFAVDPALAWAQTGMAAIAGLAIAIQGVRTSLVERAPSS